MFVKDIMTTALITCPDDATIEQALHLLSDHRLSILPVVNRSGQLQGVLQESDFMAKFEEVPHGFSVTTLLGEYLDSSSPISALAQSAQQPVSDIMSRRPLTVTPETELNFSLQLMLENGHSRLVVVENERPIGIVSSHDIMRQLLKMQRDASLQMKARAAEF